jgi:glutaredoxin-like YruB-family protein
MAKNEITIYSTPSCHFCLLAKEWFKEKGVEFKDVDVSRDHDAAKEMIEKSGQMGVPVVEINGELIIGFRPDVFEGLLKKD